MGAQQFSPQGVGRIFTLGVTLAKPKELVAGVSNVKAPIFSRMMAIFQFEVGARLLPQGPRV